MRRHVNIYALRIPKVVMDIFKDVKKDCLTSGKKKVCRLFRHTSQSMYVQGFSSIHRNKTEHRSNNGHFFPQGRKTRPTIAFPIHLAFLDL